MIHVSKAPLRIGIAGGGTDVSPYSEMHGGAILNGTISLYAHATLIPRDDGKIIFRAIDRNEEEVFESIETLPISEKLKLQKGIYNRIVRDFSDKPLSFELITHIDAPTGSGLGTSSTLVVAIIGAFVEWLNLPLGEYDIARLAYQIEREDLNMAGGKQDQYAATFGGINFMEFKQDGSVIINPLRVKNEILQELQFHLLLFYTQTSRESSQIIEAQKESFQDNTEVVLNATHNLKKQAFQMKEAMLRADISEMGDILDYGWINKKKLASGITNESIDNIYTQATSAGATGGKISGAGGGGFMIFYAPGGTKYKVIEVLEAIGVKHQIYSFVKNGLTTWTSHQ